MHLSFRIDWGYQYLYSRRHYHPIYLWDGTLRCTEGMILGLEQLSYPVNWFGPVQSPVRTPLPGCSWESRTRRGLAGIHVDAEVGQETVFHLATASFSASFSAEQIIAAGRLVFPVGPKYLGCFVTVTRDGFLWFRDSGVEGETVFDADALGLAVEDQARMRLGMLEPGASVSLPFTVHPLRKDVSFCQLHLIGMPVPVCPDVRATVEDDIALELRLDGESVRTFCRRYRDHDTDVQLLEDEWQQFSAPTGEHILTLVNGSRHRFGISRLTLRQCGRSHGELSVPAWALTGEEVEGKVYAARPDTITVQIGEREQRLACMPGWNAFPLMFDDAGVQTVRTAQSSAQIEILRAQEENPPVKVGYDMTVVPHDAEHMDWLLDYTARTRLGNYVNFRSFTGPVSDELLTRWGDFCRAHGIFVGAACEECFGSGALMRAAGPFAADCGRHEFPGAVYAFDPEEPYASQDMKEASEHYIAHLAQNINATRSKNPRVGYGDASGGIRYSFLAGADFVRAETMVGNTMTLLSQARPAAEALGRCGWGVHIAMQHDYQPYQLTHLGQYFLSLMQPWAMGAEMIYEEDSLFLMFKEERQTWDDVLTKGKRDMTRSFFRFVKTHPRTGRCVRSIAFLEGRYAAPFSGFICGPEQDPSYSVWGLYGNSSPAWGHLQPEKCRQLLDVLMPGASTHPLRQRFDRRRYFFAGTPYGDFDCVPIEAETAYLSGYRLLLNLGWNTMLDADYEKLLQYVREGGTLLTGLPQFSTHVRREFLLDMEDLSLWNGGDLRELCGIRVLGRGVRYSGQWNCAGKENVPEPELSAIPSSSVTEDGPAYLADIALCGAEVVAWDADSARPMLVRNHVGKGTVYTFTAWAYPGHEQLQRFSASWLAYLSAQSLPEPYVLDPSGEVFWTVWESDAECRVLLLNTDWTQPDGVRTVTLVHPGGRVSVDVREGALTEAVLSGKEAAVRSWTLERV